MARVELESVTRVDGATRILDTVSLHADDGEFVSVIGHSGAGKSSVLRAVAGFDPLTSGVVRIDGNDVTQTPTAERDVGMITQHNTLFPNHRVRSNLLFPLRARNVAKTEARKRIEAESRALNIDHILERWPDSLSGGEQRLAQIARALVRVPNVFLMDEPLAKLDTPLRRRLRIEIAELQRGYGVTTIYASNSPEEIMTMPDRLVALDHGRVIQTGSPSAVRARPATLPIAELTGPISRLTVTIEADTDGFWITGDGVRLRAWAPTLADQIGRNVTLAARCEHVHLAPDGPLTMQTGAATFVESRSARELRSTAGVLHTRDTEIAAETTVSVTLDRWLLFSDRGELILAFPS